MMIELSDETEKVLERAQNDLREKYGKDLDYSEIVNGGLKVAAWYGRLSDDAVEGIDEVKEYLKKKGMEADGSDIISASLKIAERMGAGKYGIYCELKEDK